MYVCICGGSACGSSRGRGVGGSGVEKDGEDGDVYVYVRCRGGIGGNLLMDRAAAVGGSFSFFLVKFFFGLLNGKGEWSDGFLCMFLG